jgi:FkbM family methyltransferase
LLAADCDFVLVTRRDLKWKLSLSDVVGREVFVAGGYQEEAVAAIDTWLRASGRFPGRIVDVGANIGTTTVPLAHRGWSVIAIEPVPAAMDLLSENVRMNGLDDRVTTICAAVSAGTDPVSMALSGDLGHSEVAVDAEQGFGPNVADLITVDSAPLASLLQQAGVRLDDVSIVWSDTQGHEAQVLLTGEELWGSGIPCFMEVWPRGLRSHGGLEEFERLACRHFKSFVTYDDLIRTPICPPLRSIGELSGFVRKLDEMPPGDYGQFSDVLLIPQ